jgi:hypothetical protein
MSKLSLNALKERAEAVASQDLLNSISGGTENACHDGATGPGMSWREIEKKLGEFFLRTGW